LIKMFAKITGEEIDEKMAISSKKAAIDIK
jgi:hypothetical protein